MSITAKEIEEMSDKKVLKQFLKYLPRVEISAQLIEEEEGLFTGHILTIQSGDKYIQSDPVMFDWPLQRMPIPDALKGSLN